MKSKEPDEDACLVKLVQLVRNRYSTWLTYEDPPRLTCRKCPHCEKSEVKVHRRQRAPLLDYLCRRCRRVFNVWHGTVFQGTQRKPSDLVALVVGVVDGKTTSQLARDLGCNRAWLVTIRRKLEAEEFVHKLKLQNGPSARKFNDLWMSDLRKLVAAGRTATPNRAVRETQTLVERLDVLGGGLLEGEQERA